RQMCIRDRCFIGCDPARPFDFTAGPKGISPISTPAFGNVLGIPKIYGFVNGDYVPWYFLALALLAGSAFFIFRLRDSRMGRAWVSMREDELAANAMGVDIVRTKLLAFIIGAMFSGFAGGFYASYVSFIEPGSFAFDISVTVLAMVILGGTGNITGVILGAFIVRVIDLVVLERLKQLINGVTESVFFSGIQNPALVQFVQSIADATAYKVMLFGLILVIMMKVRPQGLIPAETAAQKRKA
ncbi:MAG: branched-chain amino acid ABC transporter permease, partial [Anaerolineae bacterium]|nr:branched-chain amino acid ABC transporter permease [Anaerolineae bacterium]